MVSPKKNHGESNNHNPVYKWQQSCRLPSNGRKSANGLREGRPERPRYDSETRTVIMGHFEFCQTVAELSIEHQRTVERIDHIIDYAEQNYPGIVALYKSRKKLHKGNR